jgi:Predicted membrane protein
MLLTWLKKWPIWKITFKGRIDQKRYIWYPLAVACMFFGPVIIGVLIAPNYGSGLPFHLSPRAYPTCILILICYVIYWLSLTVRRLHDLDRVGWLVLVCFLPVVNIFLIAWLTFSEGMKGDNEYGKNPLEYESYGEYLEYVKNL